MNMLMKKRARIDSIEAYAACVCMAATCTCSCTCDCSCHTGVPLANEGGSNFAQNYSATDVSITVNNTSAEVRY